MPNTLYVEGDTDKSFFAALLLGLDQLHGLKNLPIKTLGVECKVQTPKDAGKFRNGLHPLLTVLGERLNDIVDEVKTNSSPASRYAFVFDADEDFSQRSSEIQIVFGRYGFALNECCALGFLFSHQDYGAHIPVWIMPNNRDKGELEHLLLDALQKDELLAYAQLATKKVPDPRFTDAHCEKASVLAYLAWQESPSRSYSKLCDHLDPKHKELVNLITWLQNTFNQKIEQNE